MDFEEFTARHEQIQERLAALLHFTYDWDTKMGSSANKQRIHRDYEWTKLMTHCVWVTTAFRNDRWGPLDRLYTESVTHKEQLKKKLQAFVFDCTLDAKENIHNRRDGMSQAGTATGVRVKKTSKKARVGGKKAGQHVQMTELLGVLRGCLRAGEASEASAAGEAGARCVGVDAFNKCAGIHTTMCRSHS